jgi:SOS-response transcriptional repressor LexA
VALIEDGYTLKYLQKTSDGRLYLEAANDLYEPIFPRDGQIVGVVVSTFRTYHK